MRRSLAEPNSLRATPPIIASSFLIEAAGTGRLSAHDVVPREHDLRQKPERNFRDHAGEFLARLGAMGAGPTSGKCGAIGTYARRHRAAELRWRHRRGSVACQCGG